MVKNIVVVIVISVFMQVCAEKYITQIELEGDPHVTRIQLMSFIGDGAAWHGDHARETPGLTIQWGRMPRVYKLRTPINISVPYAKLDIIIRGVDERGQSKRLDWKYTTEILRTLGDTNKLVITQNFGVKIKPI